MSKDDYAVIVYQILAYLYDCLKKDRKVEGEKIYWNSSPYFAVNENYWKYVIVSMMDQELISGITLTQHWGQEYPIIQDLDSCRITPKGIEYVCDNSFMEKAKRFLKTAKEVTPFI